MLGAFTMFQLSRLNLNAGYWDIFWPQVFQGVALACLFIPLMALSMSGIAKEKMGNATSIFNLMRNIGGSFGIAIMTTLLARRTQLHQVRLIENVTYGDLETRKLLTGLQAWFHSQSADAVTANRKALGAIYGLVQRHASMLSFVEAFWIMSIMFLAMLPFLLLLRYRPHEPTPEAVSPSGVHRLPETEPVAQEEEELLLVH
jgi:DHA2 family multidrug resistance protein